MTRPPTSDAPAPAAAGGVSMRRTALWVLLAIVLVTGLVLYFRYQSYVVPIVDHSSGAVR